MTFSEAHAAGTTPKNADNYSRKCLNIEVGQSFSGSFRGECLNANWFLSLSDTRAK